MKKRGKKRTARKGRKRSVTTTVCRKVTLQWHKGRIVSGRSSATLKGLQGVSRTDFSAIAKVLCETGAPSSTTAGIARYFGSKNPRFDEGRFVKAATTCKR